MAVSISPKRFLLSFDRLQYAPALLALLIPLLLHFRRKRVERTAPLPTLQFLQRAIARQSPISRKRDLLLLIIRMLLLLMVVLVFLRPVLSSRLSARGSVKGRIRILILDRSLSMSRMSGGVSAFTEAKSLASRLLRECGPMDHCGVILAGSKPEILTGGLSADSYNLQTLLDSTSFSLGDADFPASIALTQSLLSQNDQLQRELIILSDFQKQDWQSPLLKNLPAGIQITCLKVGNSTGPNAGITGLKLEPPFPRPGESASLIVSIRQAGMSGKVLPVTLHEENELIPAQTDSIALSTAGSDTARFQFTMPLSGSLKLQIKIPEDAMPGDNTRRLAWNSESGPDVCLLTNQPRTSRGREYLLSRAFNPRPEAPGGITVHRLNPEQALLDKSLQAEFILIPGGAVLSNDLVGVLHTRLQDGASILLFLDAPKAAALANRLLGVKNIGGKALAKLAPLPVPKGALVDPVNDNLRRLDAASHSGFARIHVLMNSPMPDPPDSYETLLKLSDGAPLLTRRTIGKGKLYFCSLLPDGNFSDLGTQPIFPPLMHSILQEAGITSGADSGVVGRGVEMTSRSGNTAFRLTGPEGETISTTHVTGNGKFQFTPERPGWYQLSGSGISGRVISVNSPAEESDPETLSTIELQRLTTSPRTGQILSGAGDAGLRALQNSRPLWGWCLLAAGLLMLLEIWIREGRMVAGNWWSREKLKRLFQSGALPPSVRKE